ncbi:hypothetical protein [Sporosarcina sp. FSL K6-3457]
MKKFLVITLLLVGFTLSIVSAPLNSASSIDNVPDPQVKPFSQKDVM